MKFSRDPAFYAGLFAVLLQLCTAFFLPLTADQQTALNAVVVALAGAVTAVAVRRDGQVAALVGLAQAAIAVAINFGLHMGADQQAAVMAFVTTLATAYVRTQVEAKAPASRLTMRA
jgi:hypothetical protein